MKYYITVQQLKDVLNYIECDRCHKIYSDIIETQEFLSIDFTGGYASYFEDGIQYHADICDKCKMELLGKYLKPVNLVQ